MHPENEQIPLQNTYIPYPLPAQHTPLQQQYPQMYPMPHPVENNYAIPQAYTSPQQIPPQEMQQMPPQPPPAPPPHEMYPPPQEMHSQPQEMYSPPQDMYPQEMYPPPQEIYPQPTSYSQLPRRQTRRYKTTRQVKLTKGNLILDCPVPTTYLNEVPIKEGKEFTHMRYTAATCDPKDFIQDAYTLRQPMLQRNTELFIVLTMYNEDEVLFARTMHGVMKNMAHLCTRDRSRTWGANSWDKVVVCIVSDGRSKINPRTLSLLALLGVYQEGVAKNVVHGKPVTAHIYEYTTQISVDSKMDIKKAGSKSIVPCQILFCLKEKNQKKINSHRWFFQAFAPILNPNVCVLIDVGTKPGNKSLYHLWKTFDINANVAGACGEIRAMGRTALLNPLVAAQNFEYKMSNILDKPLESVFGYISVLPGAFSAYRYTALQNHLDGTGPLEKYFLGETQHGGDSDIFTANMYLAEDRILCYELVAKKDANWVLHYVSSAHGETDVPDSVAEFISQRRRWLNANFYLTFYILTKALGSDESTGFSPRPFSAETGEILHTVLNYIYIVLIIVQFIIAMGNRPQGSRLAYTGSMVFFALLMIYLMFAAIWITVVGVRAVLENTNGESVFAQAAFRNIVVSLCATYAMYIVSSVMFLDPWHMITSFLQYILLSPSYTNVLNIYAFCNTHDVSWGTKGDTGLATDLGIVQATKDAAGDLAVEIELPVQEKDINAAYIDAQHLLSKKIEPERVRRDPKTKQEDYYRSFRTRLVIAWIISNLALVAVITNTSIQANQDSVYLGIILWSVAGLALIRFVGSTLYLILRIFTG